MSVTTQFEFSGGMPHTKEGIRSVSTMVMHALCGNAPETVVPIEYTHCKATAVDFVRDHLMNQGVLPETIMAGIQTAHARYARK